jgi:hypothetical protein
MDENALAALDELSALTQRLAELNPHEFDAVSETLTRRSHVALRIHRLVTRGGAPPDERALQLLRDAFGKGAEIVRRLQVARAKLRAEYEGNSRTNGYLRSVRPAPAVSRGGLDLRG